MRVTGQTDLEGTPDKCTDRDTPHLLSKAESVINLAAFVQLLCFAELVKSNLVGIDDLFGNPSLAGELYPVWAWYNLDFSLASFEMVTRSTIPNSWTSLSFRFSVAEPDVVDHPIGETFLLSTIMKGVTSTNGVTLDGKRRSHFLTFQYSISIVTLRKQHIPNSA